MGLLITFEGIDGSGKSTQLQMLQDRLRSIGYKVVTTREPGGTRLGERVREILLHEDHPISEWAEFFLYAASRAQLARQVIQPALNSGAIVLCDRYIDSSMAYQGYGLGMPLDALRRVNAWATEDVKPDLTLLLDLQPELALQRRSSIQQDRIEQRKLDFHRRVRDGYLELARMDQERVKVIRADQPVEAVAQEIERYVLDRLH